MIKAVMWDVYNLKMMYFR
jgi:tartrate-resistant acid phosphatase type 5